MANSSKEPFDSSAEGQTNSRNYMGIYGGVRYGADVDNHKNLNYGGGIGSGDTINVIPDRDSCGKKVIGVAASLGFYGVDSDMPADLQFNVEKEFLAELAANGVVPRSRYASTREDGNTEPICDTSGKVIGGNYVPNGRYKREVTYRFACAEHPVVAVVVLDIQNFRGQTAHACAEIQAENPPPGKIQKDRGGPVL